MNLSRIVNIRLICWLAIIVIFTSCNATKNVPKDKYLLRNNSLTLKASVSLTQKGQLKESITKLYAQKINNYAFGIIPFKVGKYNRVYEKYQKKPGRYVIKSRGIIPPVLYDTVAKKVFEAPVVYDSSLKKKTATNIKSFLFNKGFFYAKVSDTTIFKGRKAFVKYKVETGTNYLINNIKLDIIDSATNDLVAKSMPQTILKKGTDFSYDLCEQERSRITNILRDWGYYKFTNDNISFKLDTLNKNYFRNTESAIESALDFIAQQSNKKKPTLDIKIIIRCEEDTNYDCYKRYGIGRMRIFPDFESNKDFRDTSMIQTKQEGVLFKYHKRYVNENVLLRHMPMVPGRYYSQTEYDQTLTKLNDLGIFQSIRITFREDTLDPWIINCNVAMTPNDKYTYNTSWELSNGTTYTAGSNLTVSLLNRNFGKGANLLTTSVTGGVETTYDTTSRSLKLLTKSIGANISLDMPKFLFPLKQSEISSYNTPRTIFSAGINFLDRVNYFQLTNISGNFMYKWKETKTKNWEVSPVFINIIDIHNISPLFQQRLDSNQYLKNSYSPAFIEGENVARVLSDKEVKHGRNYNYLRLSFEEAGGLMKGISLITPIKSFSQYVKFDVDAQHFFTWLHSMVAMRLQIGVGIPYDNSSTLPYVKQYFVGGANSLRGYRIRTLGPGSYLDTSAAAATAIIDRIGDIKLEYSTEYRYDIVKLFSGTINLNGAVFIDAGNIWLAENKKDIATGQSYYPNGEFAFSKLYKDLAISGGTGLRLDVAGFFLFRVDVGFPLKKPYYFNGTVPKYYYGADGWVIDQIHLDKSDWRKSNLVWNFAIGYPF
ncbi:MAG: BamA/TamA family outer membrane protein [Bacteroidetes bacterium]|nr:BamA/TamA family outer membrane protein [Bacteroidota bacterium]